MYRRLTFPSTMFTQNTNDIGNILLHRCSEATSISGLVLSTLIATYAPMEEHTKCTQETVRGNLNSSFCPIKTKGGTSASRVYVSQKKKKKKRLKSLDQSERRNRQDSGMKEKNCDLEDPLVHDDDGDVESPPLEDREHRADRGGAAHLPVLRRHGWKRKQVREPAQRLY
jgi:hypothetical protein